MKNQSLKKPLFSSILGDQEEFSLSARVFHACVLFTVLLCLATFVTNISLRLTPFSIYSSGISTIFFSVIFYISRYFKIFTLSVWLSSLWLPIFIACGWIVNSGSTGATHAFLIVMPLFFLPVATVKQRIILTILYCLVSIGLLSYEFLYPNNITGYSNASIRFPDMLFATLGTQLVIVITISFFLREHKTLTIKLMQLREKSEKRFGVVADTIPAGIVEISQELSIDFANRACIELTGFSQHELTTSNGLSRIIHTEDWPHIKSKIDLLIATGTTISDECRLLTKNESVKTVLFRAIPRKRDGVQSGLIVYMVDITEKKLLEQQYLKAQKMESIGMLAGGIAHDFNNLLTGIMGYSNLIKIENTDSAKNILDANLNEKIQPIITASQRAADLVKKLLIFSRQQQLQKVNFDLREIIREAHDLLSHSLDKKIAIVVTCEDSPFLVFGDRSLLVSSLINLGVNARDAMPQGGTLSISCRFVATHPHARTLLEESTSTNGYAEITVSDTGTGMSQHVLQHLFEPFFTTKDIGKGTGLGLASVHGAVIDHGGSIHVESEIGKGTTFIIHIPLCANDATASKELVTEKNTITSKQRILVVDDELLVGSFVKEVLMQAGHDVVLLSDPTLALSTVTSSAKPFTLAVVDMIMPHMNGVELIKILHEGNPKLRVLLVSGHARNGDTQIFINNPYVKSLGKPFDPKSLLDAINRLVAIA